MRVHTLRYTPTSGWSGPFPDTDPEHTFVACFGASKFIDETDPIRELANGVSGMLIGCSTSGEIHGARVYDDTLAVSVAEFERTDLRRVDVPISGFGSFDAGVSLARRLDGPGLRAVFVLSDGLEVNGSELVRGLNSVLPSSVTVTGGLAGDGPRFERTWVIVDDKPVSGFASAIGFYGEAVRIGHGSKGGWDKFGRERTVTKAKGNVVFELDNRSILDLYREYLGELAAELPASGLLFPLAVRAPGNDKLLVRTILGVDDRSGSMTFAGDVPQGHKVQLMQANFDRLVDGAEEAAETTLENAGADAGLSIAISCVGRRLVLGERSEEELEATLHILPDDIAQVGFYSYGELSPYASGGCDLHNQTMTLTTFGEIV